MNQNNFNKLNDLLPFRQPSHFSNCSPFPNLLFQALFLHSATCSFIPPPFFSVSFIQQQLSDAFKKTGNRKCHIFNPKSIKTKDNLYNFVSERNIWKCPEFVLSALYSFWLCRWPKTSPVIGFFWIIGLLKLSLTTDTFIENFIKKILQSMATEIVCTFEFGFKSAKETENLQVLIWGCYFHSTMTLLKKIKDLQLFTHYMDGPFQNGFLREQITIS